jgi:hypothetical protein
MKHAFILPVLGLSGCLFLIGCASMSYQTVGTTAILQAREEIPESELLDVGVLVFDSEEVTEEVAEEEGTTPEIRKAETHFVPYHLKHTLQKSSHWGAVRVLPADTASVDVFVHGKILESTGEQLVVQVDVRDAAGNRWFKKTYEAHATERSYSDTQAGRKDAFQDLYNAIANDMAQHRMELPTGEAQRIRTISQLKFAQTFAPDAFEGYLARDKKERLAINRLPADSDPMMARLLEIREREYMYVDTLNEFYERFYNEMWPPYENWRELSLTERKAMKRIQREAALRQLAGVLLLAGAIALGASDLNNVGGIQAGMVIIGGQVIIDGFNVSKEADIHSGAIRELSESFSSEMKPVVMDFEGKQYELTGSAEEQFAKWRELLRRIYFAETGFDESPGTSEPTGTAPLYFP